MKIALCLSGQPRGIPLSLQLLNEAVIRPNQPDHDIDVFLHAWHDEEMVGMNYDSAQSDQNSRVGLIKPNTEELLLNSLNPKKWLVERPQTFTNLALPRSHQWADQTKLASNFYSSWKSNQLKIQHELEQNEEYDVVIKTRYDLFYKNKIVLNNLVDTLTDNNIVVSRRYQDDQDRSCNSDKPLVDTFAIGSTKTINVFCGVYPEMESLNKKVNPPFGENYLGRWVTVVNQIDIEKTEKLNYEILHRVVDLSNI